MVLVFALWACGEAAPEGPVDTEVEAVSVVEAAPVGRGTVADQLLASAVVESEAQADLVPEASGVVSDVLVDEGDVVRAGQVLAVLENVSLSTGAARARGEVARLEAQAAGTRELVARGAASQRDLLEAEHALRSAQLTAREASAGAGQTRIVAPFDGVVARRDVRVGEFVTSAKVAFQIVDLERLRVVASLPERELGRVAPGQTVWLASAYAPDVAYPGRVARVSPVVDPSTGTFRVAVEVAPGQGLRPGQFVAVTVEVGRHDQVVVVPKSALVYEDGAPVLYTVEEAPPPEPKGDAEAEAPAAAGWWPFGAAEEPEIAVVAEADEHQVAERHLVQLGLVDAEWAEIVSGVEPGDTVITVGQSHLRDGARVRPVAPGAEAAPEAAPEAGPDAAPADGEAG